MTGKRVAVVLSGCGVFDGAEIYEATLTLLRLDECDAKVQCFAPDMPQMHVVNHATGQESPGEARNVLVEAGRLARGKVRNVREAKATDFDALIVPGGFGAAKNLSSFATQGDQMKVQPDFLAFAQAMHKAGKPIGLICIAPAMSAAICGAGVKCTIGDDAETAEAIQKMGGVHQQRSVHDICVDEQHKLVTTPAYMLAGRIREAASGIFKLVDKVLALA